MIRAILVDDELPAIERFKKLLRVYSDVDVVGEAHDGLAALELIQSKKPDLVFLDIAMPELNGLEVARTLGINGPSIVFVTAYDEHALAAFESNAIDYLVKPINTSRLDLTIEKLRKSFQSKNPHPSHTTFLKSQENRRLAVKIGTRYEIFDPKKISVAFSRDHYTALLVEGRELLSDDSLEAILERLDPSTFVRVHRSSIINIHYLKELKREGDRKFTAILADPDQTQVNVSRERLPILKEILGLRLGPAS